MLCPRLGWKAPLRSAGNMEYSTTISLYHPSFQCSCPLVSKGHWFQDFPRGTKIYGCSSPTVSLPSIYSFISTDSANSGLKPEVVEG